MKLKTDEQIASKFFLLLHVEDRAGVLAQIAQVFSDCDVSIESVMQPPNLARPTPKLLLLRTKPAKRRPTGPQIARSDGRRQNDQERIPRRRISRRRLLQDGESQVNEATDEEPMTHGIG